MQDVMVSLHEQGVECAALVHQHEPELRTSVDTLEFQGSKFEVVRAGVLLRLLYTPVSPTFPWLLNRLFKEFQPDILHIHMPNPSAICALVSARARKVPWVLHWHSDVVASSVLMRVVSFVYRLFERKMLQRADTIIATSAAYRDSSEFLAEFLDKCEVVTLGIDRRRFISEQKVSTSPLPVEAQEKLKVLAIGRLTYYKGFDYLVKAAAIAQAVKVSIVGSGDREKELKALVAELGMEERVFFHGALTDSELMQQLAQCDCLCLPSIERTEAFGIVLLEAMYFGKATVVTDVPGTGMSWVVEDGVTGIRVKAANAQDLARALNYLSENRGVVSEMGRRGREKFDQQFEIEHSARSLTRIYQRLLEHQP